MPEAGTISHSTWQISRSSNEVIIVLASALLIWAHVEWIGRVQRIVPEPYLDEFFHIPQASAYWQGYWYHWDDKITTPPGLYIYSVLFSRLFWFDPSQSQLLSSHQARLTNAVLLYLLVAVCIIWQWAAGRTVLPNGRPPIVLSIFVFPLFFFFSGLYYTDLYSAFTVMCSYSCWQASLQAKSSLTKLTLQLMHFACGLLALASRQTNVFWVAVYIGGLQAVHTIKQKATIHDPVLADACFADYASMIIALVTSATTTLFDLIMDLWPQLGLIGSFAVFIFWNGGVVLGDKSNHMASIHLAQMLYLWPLLIFFSWPLVLPFLAKPKALIDQRPRLWSIACVVLAMLAIVHYNTVVHPFLLADNRHYTFYVFKALRIRPWLWYAAVPIYTVCAWLSLHVLGDRTVASQEARKVGTTIKTSTALGRLDIVEEETATIRISWVLIWLLSTALSLVTAPLVEPRYFIVPWLMWRLHIPEWRAIAPASQSFPASPHGNSVYLARQALHLVVNGRGWIEIAWYMLINLITCRLFLRNGFTWPQEPDKTQRFMW